MKVLIVNDDNMSQLMQEMLLVKQCNVKTNSIEKAYNGLEAY